MPLSDFNHEEFNSEWRCAESSLTSDQARCDQAPRRVQLASRNKANPDSGRVRGSSIFDSTASVSYVVFLTMTAIDFHGVSKSNNTYICRMILRYVLILQGCILATVQFEFVNNALA